MHTIYSTVQYCYEIDLVKKVHSAKIACWPLTVLLLVHVFAVSRCITYF